MAGTPAALDFGSSELVLGLVSPVGTDLSAIQGSLVEHFRTFSYDVKTIKLSSFLDRLSPKSLGVKVVARPEFDRIRTHMDAGDALRTRGGRGDLLALHAAREIALSRQRTDAGPRPLERTVHILHSLKNPDEVTVLRRNYGPGFFLIAVYASADPTTNETG